MNETFSPLEKRLIVMRVYTPGDRDQVKINNLHLTEWRGEVNEKNKFSKSENNVTMNVAFLFIHILIF